MKTVHDTKSIQGKAIKAGKWVSRNKWEIAGVVIGGLIGAEVAEMIEASVEAADATALVDLPEMK